MDFLLGNVASVKWWFILVNTVISVKMTSIFRRFGLLSQKLQSCVFVFMFYPIVDLWVAPSTWVTVGNVFCFFVCTKNNNHQNERKLIFYHTTSSVPCFIHHFAVRRCISSTASYPPGHVSYPSVWGDVRPFVWVCSSSSSSCWHLSRPVVNKTRAGRYLFDLFGVLLNQNDES